MKKLRRLFTGAMKTVVLIACSLAILDQAFGRSASNPKVYSPDDYIFDYSWSNNSSKFVTIGNSIKIIDRDTLIVEREYTNSELDLCSTIPETVAMIGTNENLSASRKYQNKFNNSCWVFVDWSQNSDTFAAAKLGAAYVFSLSSKQPLCKFEYNSRDPSQLKDPYFGIGFSGISLSPDGKRIALCTESGIGIFQVSNRKKLYEYEPFVSNVSSPYWSSDGQFLAAIGETSNSKLNQSEVHIWNANSGSTIAVLKTTDNAYPAFQWLPTGVIAVNQNSGISFYRIENKEIELMFTSKINDPMRYFWNCNGEKLAVSFNRKSSIEIKKLQSIRTVKRLFPSTNTRSKFLFTGTRLIKWLPDQSAISMVARGGPMFIWSIQEESTQ